MTIEREQKKYTLGEAAAGLTLMGIGTPIIIFAVMIAILPIDLAMAWMRTRIWNWFFVPYLHLPPMNIWLMFAIVLFLAMFRKSSRSMKDDLYKESLWSSLLNQYVVEALLFCTLYGIHHWILP